MPPVTDRRVRAQQILIGLNTKRKTMTLTFFRKSHSPSLGRKQPLPAPSVGRSSLLMLLCLLGSPLLHALTIGQDRYVDPAYHPGDFSLVARNAAATLFVDSADFPGVVRAANDLQADIERVTNRVVAVAHDEKRLGSNVIIVGTAGKSKIIDQLIRDHKIDVTAIAGKWESFLIQVVPKPLPGVASALIIAGSDKRGTIYGIYDLSSQIGVSPWYWWADVPIQHHDELFVKPGTYVQGPPAVKYRGIFLNDEAPSLTGWVIEKYGNYNHEFYTKVFELLLRLKANYLWPAMWNNGSGMGKVCGTIRKMPKSSRNSGI